MQVDLLFRSPCTDFNLLRSFKLGCGSEKSSFTCFFARLALILQAEMKSAQ
jgi:hypothetical protein